VTAAALDDLSREKRPTDFASVPATLCALFPPYGAYTSATVLHDFLWRVLAPAGRIT
jgi:hypothetical protein